MFNSKNTTERKAKVHAIGGECDSDSKTTLIELTEQLKETSKCKLCMKQTKTSTTTRPIKRMYKTEIGIRRTAVLPDGWTVGRQE